ncbi:MAG: endonuclease V [Planctomycetota bacterium]|jgi:deoxyribonuclease V
MARSIKHRWDLAPKAAVRLQRELGSEVMTIRPPWGRKLKGLVVAGADVSCPRGSKLLRAAVVALRLPGFDVLGAARIEREATFPYVPGLLSFREAPIVLDCFAKLRKELQRAQGIKIDCLMCDGQGVAHPRGLGLASHVGLWLGVPTVGCAKSRLCGEHVGPGPARGDWEALRLKDKIVGRVLRTRDGVKPLYVSVGHLTTLAAAAKLVLECAPCYRLPEPTRLAHHAAGWRGAEDDLLPELRRIVRTNER